MSLDLTALAVFVFFFLLVTVLGFFAARWKAGDLTHINEWGLAGRQFGTLITWFLIGGDFYTAYTVIAVPALVFGSGAPGFFALPYTIVVYPFVYMTMPRLWNVCKKHGFVTPADFVFGRYGSRTLALMVAITGILAVLPYIALQLVGMQVVIGAMGVGGSGLANDLPLIVAFLILAAYTYTSGLRAPAMIAFVKDVMIYVTVIAAVIVIPAKLGGLGHVIDLAQAAYAARPPDAPKANVILQYAINLQLLGGVWILQTLPAIIFGLYTRWFHHLALFWGWLIAMLLGTSLALAQGLKSTYPVHLGGLTITAYIAVEALVVNLLVALVLTPLFDRAGIRRGPDLTAGDHYEGPPEEIVPTTTLGTRVPV